MDTGQRGNYLDAQFGRDARQGRCRSASDDDSAMKPSGRRSPDALHRARARRQERPARPRLERSGPRPARSRPAPRRGAGLGAASASPPYVGAALTGARGHGRVHGEFRRGPDLYDRAAGLHPTMRPIYRTASFRVRVGESSGLTHSTACWPCIHARRLVFQWAPTASSCARRESPVLEDRADQARHLTEKGDLGRPAASARLRDRTPGQNTRAGARAGGPRAEEVFKAFRLAIARAPEPPIASGGTASGCPTRDTCAGTAHGHRGLARHGLGREQGVRPRATSAFASVAPRGPEAREQPSIVASAISRRDIHGASRCSTSRPLAPACCAPYTTAR